MKEVVKVPSGHGVGIENGRGVVLAEQLHPDHGENINDNDQNERQVS